jgi:uncharacterized protein (DUF1810 family)
MDDSLQASLSPSAESHFDEYNLKNRFVRTQKKYFSQALMEINAGHKVGHWSWYIFPVAPFVVDGQERGSGQNSRFALRDKTPDGLTGANAARAYLKFESEGFVPLSVFLPLEHLKLDVGVNLRLNYITIMTAVEKQLNKGSRFHGDSVFHSLLLLFITGISPTDLVGRADDPKLRSSLRLFERVTRLGYDVEVNELCLRVLSALREDADPTVAIEQGELDGECKRDDALPLTLESTTAPCSTHLIFVYGTLKRGFHWNRKFLTFASYHSEARTVEAFPLVHGTSGVPYLLADLPGKGNKVTERMGAQKLTFARFTVGVW